MHRVYLHLCLVIFPFAEAIPHIPVLHLSTVASCRKYRQLPPTATKSYRVAIAPRQESVSVCIYVCAYRRIVDCTLRIGSCFVQTQIFIEVYCISTPRQAAPFYCFSNLSERNPKKKVIS